MKKVIVNSLNYVLRALIFKLLTHLYMTSRKNCTCRFVIEEGSAKSLCMRSVSIEDVVKPALVN